LCFYIYFFGGLEFVGHSFAYVAHFAFLRDVWIRTQRAAVTSRRTSNLATHLPTLATHLLDLATHLPNLSAHLPDLATYLPNLATHLPDLATHLPNLATHLPFVFYSPPPSPPVMIKVIKENNRARICKRLMPNLVIIEKKEDYSEVSDIKVRNAEALHLTTTVAFSMFSRKQGHS
jgi:hypothetical protein